MTNEHDTKNGNTTPRPERDTDRNDTTRHTDREDRPARHDRPDRDGARRTDAAHRRPAFREDREGRPSRRGPREGRDGDGTGPVQMLMELDQDIMKLLVRRAKLVSRLRGGRDHASSPAAIKAEKEVRASWEKNAVRFSRDSKFTRQLFALLQDLKVSTREESETLSGFTLAPPRKPVTIALPGPGDMRSTRLAAALAAGLGKGASFRGVVLNNALLEFVKALNLAGASFAWTGTWPDETRLHHNAWSGPDADLRADAPQSGFHNDDTPLFFGDKVLYAGEDRLSFYLLLFLAAGGVGKTRFTGGGPLKMADFSPLRRFLPHLGARLAHTMPGGKGLPASLESSGVIPATLEIPDDLDEEAILALLCAAPAWGGTVRLNTSRIPGSVLDAVLGRVAPLFRDFGVRTSSDGAIFSLTPPAYGSDDETAVPEYRPVLDAEISAYLLALPAFAGGVCRLDGTWPALFPAGHVLDLLRSAGLEASTTDGAVSVTAAPASATPHVLLEGPLSPALTPLRHALAALAAVRSPEKTGFIAPATETDETRAIAESFYAALGLSLEEDGTLSPLPEDEETPPVWTSPNTWWTFAFALTAYCRARLRISNPGLATDIVPGFWNLYNALPNPVSGGQPQKTEAPTPQRRRIRTSSHLEEGEAS
ncbi:5-enolpyruvylshikimate-3-phosphate synthase [Desulfovibrio sp. OttesenSCG-928-I05]|nr:5-enolpyruvylshikimate-3-phosphate synthase [Desulfovibrio sp. OttesenSCG-928-I05]